MSADRKIRVLAWGALLWSAVALAGCSTSISELPLIGTPAGAPAASKEAGGYLPVEDLPPNRDEAAMAPADRAKLKAELLAARDRQASVATGKDPAAKDPAVKDPKARKPHAKELSAKDPSAKDLSPKDLPGKDLPGKDPAAQ
jgi:hypothetical protein